MDGFNPVWLRVWGATELDAREAEAYARSRPSSSSWDIGPVRRLTGVPCPIDVRDPTAVAAEAGFGWAYAFYPGTGGADLYRVEGDGPAYFLTRTEAESRFLDRKFGGETGLEGDLDAGFSYPLREAFSGFAVGTVRVLPASAEELQREATGDGPRP